MESGRKRQTKGERKRGGETYGQAAREAARDPEEIVRKREEDRQASRCVRWTARADVNLKCKYWKTTIHTCMKQTGIQSEAEENGRSQSVSGGERRSDRKGGISGVYDWNRVRLR